MTLIGRLSALLVSAGLAPVDAEEPADIAGVLQLRADECMFAANAIRWKDGRARPHSPADAERARRLDYARVVCGYLATSYEYAALAESRMPL